MTLRNAGPEMREPHITTEVQRDAYLNDTEIGLPAVALVSLPKPPDRPSPTASSPGSDGDQLAEARLGEAGA